MTTLIDYICEEDYARYNELLAKAQEAKKNAPKAPRAPKGPMTIEQKTKMASNRLAKAKDALEKLLASKTAEVAEPDVKPAE